MITKKQDNKKTMLSKQQKGIIVLAVFAIILAVSYIIVSNIKHDYSIELALFDEHGDKLDYTYVSANGGKVVLVSSDEDSIILDADSEITYVSRPFMYPEIAVENIKEVTVKSKNEEFSLYLDASTGEHLIRGCEMQLYNEQLLSELRFQARYMLAEQKIDGTYTEDEALCAFGLDKASNPVTVEVTDTKGNMQTVLLGNKLVNGNAYYAKHADKPYIYVLDSSASVFFNKKNDYISPVIAKPMSQNEYQYIEEFNINKYGEPFIASRIVSEEIRNNTSNTDLHKIVYPANYPASLTNYYDALYCFANLTGTAVVETNVLSQSYEDAQAIFAIYGLDIPSNDVMWTYKGNEYRFLTGNKFTDSQGNVIYYSYSPYMDTIVELPLDAAPFLEYELKDFIDESIFQININNVTELSVQTPSRSCRFVLEGTGKDLVVKETNTGTVVDTASFRQFFISLLTIKTEGYANANDITGARELSFTVNSVFGEKNKYDFDVISTTRALITLNGNSEFYTNRLYITSAAEKLELLMSGEQITPEY